MTDDSEEMELIIDMKCWFLKILIQYIFAESFSLEITPYLPPGKDFVQAFPLKSRDWSPVLKEWAQ